MSKPGVALEAMRMTRIEQICYDCAQALGWVPVPWAVGIWPGTCDRCGEQRGLTAPRDFRMPDGSWVDPNIETGDEA